MGLIPRAAKTCSKLHRGDYAPSSDVLKEYGIDTITLDRIAAHVIYIKDWRSVDYGEYFRIIANLFKLSNVGGGKGNIPGEMAAILDYRVKEYLLCDGRFLRLCGFVRGHEDQWSIVEAGVAKYCAEKYFGTESRASSTSH